MALGFGHLDSNAFELLPREVDTLGLLPPRLDGAARVTDDDEEVANSLKLILPEGDIDLFVAAPVTGKSVEDSIHHLLPRRPPAFQVFDPGPPTAYIGLTPFGRAEIGDMIGRVRAAIDNDV